MPRRDALADTVLQSRGLLMHHLNGFDDTNHTATAGATSTHVAWILGHLALDMLRAAEKLDGDARIDAGFIPGAASGDARRFGATGVACDSSGPGDAQTVYPGFSRCVEIFSHAADRVAAALRAVPDPALDEPVPVACGMLMPRWNVVPRVVFHNGRHCAQIADLRAALGLQPVRA
jgi:hypothetical protein